MQDMADAVLHAQEAALNANAWTSAGDGWVRCLCGAHVRARSDSMREHRRERCW